MNLPKARWNSLNTLNHTPIELSIRQFSSANYFSQDHAPSPTFYHMTLYKLRNITTPCPVGDNVCVKICQLSIVLIIVHIKLKSFAVWGGVHPSGIKGSHFGVWLIFPTIFIQCSRWLIVFGDLVIGGGGVGGGESYIISKENIGILMRVSHLHRA